MYSPIHSTSSPSIIPVMEDDNSISDVDSVLYTPTSPKNSQHSYHSWYSSVPSSYSSLHKHKSMDFTIQPNNNNNSNNNNNNNKSLNKTIEAYQTTFERMDHHINEFLNKRNNNKINSNNNNNNNNNNMSIIINNLKEFRDTIPSQLNITQHDSSHGVQLLNTLLSWCYEQQQQIPFTSSSSLSSSSSSSSPSSTNSLLEQAQLCFPSDLFFTPTFPNKDIKEKKLIQTIHTLVEKNQQLNQQLKQQQKQCIEEEEKDNQNDHEKTTRIMELEKQLKQEIQLKEEAEEIVESVNREMEIMMDELDQAKQKQFIYQKEIDQLRQQWQTILTHQKELHKEEEEKEKEKEKEKEEEKEEMKNNNKKKEFTPWELLNIQEKDWEYRVETLTSMLQQQELKTKQLQTKLKNHKQQHKSEQDVLQQQLKQQERQCAELQLQTSILKQQMKEKELEYQQQLKQEKEKQHNLLKKDSVLEKEQKEIIMALQQDIKEKETSLVNWEKKWNQHQQQLKYQQERQEKVLDQHRQAIMVEIQEQLEKDKLCLELTTTRQVRDLEAQLIDLEEEISKVKENNQSLIHYHHRLDNIAKERELAFSLKQKQWNDHDKLTKETILKLEQKIIGLEEEVMKLYGKNIVLANQLGECD
ncbi:unnamed protein product [Cunninghamella echinulata]